MYRRDPRTCNDTRFLDLAPLWWRELVYGYFNSMLDVTGFLRFNRRS